MQQTVLLTSIRGPDNTPKYGPVKLLQRWYRRCVVVSALDGYPLTDPYDLKGGSFTGPSMPPCSVGSDWRPEMDKLVDEYMKLQDGMPLHYHCHFMHSAEILGYHHPNRTIANWWEQVYIRLVNSFHLHPETKAELDRRLSDSRDNWLERADKATVA